MFYAVYGRDGVGIFSTWDKARIARDSMRSSNCKKFKKRKEAEKWVIDQFNFLHGCRILIEDFFENGAFGLDNLVEPRYAWAPYMQGVD